MHQARKDVGSDRRDLVVARGDPRQAQRAQALEVVRREARPEHDAGEQLRRRRQVPVEGGQRAGDLVVVGAHPEVRAERVERLAELGGRELRRALLEELGRERRQAALARALEHAPARDRQAQRGQRRARQRHAGDGQPARVAVVPHGGGPEPRRRPARRSRAAVDGPGGGGAAAPVRAGRGGQRGRGGELGAPERRHRDAQRGPVGDVAQERRAHVFGLDGLGGELLVEEARRVAGERVGERQLPRARRHGLERAGELRLAARLHAPEGGAVDAAAREIREQLAHARLEPAELDARSGRDRDREAPGELRGVVHHVHLARQDLVDHQGAVEHGRLVLREQHGEQVQRSHVGVPALGTRPGQDELRQVHAVLEHHARVAREPHRPRHDRRDLAAARDLAEVALDQRQRPVRVEIAAEGQRRIVRGVPALEEAPHVVERRPADVLGAADRRPRVRVPGGVQRGRDLERHAAVGPVLVALAPLVEHHVALVVELGLRHRRQQEAHAIGLEPQRQLELVGGQRLEVQRAVGGRVAVERAAGLADEPEVLVVADVRRALEEHVLEEVREAALARFFARAADVVADVDRHHRIGAVGVQHDLEAVREHVLLVRHREHPVRGVARARGHRAHSRGPSGPRPASGWLQSRRIKSQ